MRRLSIKKISGILLMLLFTVVVFNACRIRRSEPIRGPLAMDEPGIRNGQIVYMQYCHKCHPHGEGGLGPSINAVPAPQFIKRFQVRHGLGVMPAFKPEEISREDLRDVTEYLSALKRN
jgi:mono/diheme cytochrome c family protein